MANQHSSTATADGEGLGHFLRQLGVLRIMLLGLALLMLPFAISVPDALSGGFWTLLHGGIVPALAPLVLMGILFDALMSRVWLSEASGEEAWRLRRVLKADLAVVGLILLAWGPFFYGIFTL